MLSRLRGVSRFYASVVLACKVETLGNVAKRARSTPWKRDFR